MISRRAAADRRRKTATSRDGLAEPVPKATMRKLIGASRRQPAGGDPEGQYRFGLLYARGEG